MAGSSIKKSDLKKLYWLIIAAVLGVVTTMIAPQTGLPLTGQRFLGVAVFTVIIWATEAVSYPVSALLLIVLMTLVGVDQKTTFHQSFSSSLSGFGGTVPIAVMAGTAFARVVETTGLGQRIIYTIMKVVAGTKATAKASRVLAAMFIAEIPLSFMVPTSNGRNGIYLSLAEGLKSIFQFHQLESNHKVNPFQKAAYIACGVIPAIMGAAFLTAGEATLLAGRLIEEGTKVPQYWTNTATFLFVPTLFMLVAGWYILVRAFPSNVDNIPLGFINEKLAELGPMTRDEKYVLIALSGAIVLWLTDKLHHFPAECVLVLLAVTCFIPGVGPGNWKRDSKGIAWSAVLVIAVATSFATLLIKHGVIKLLADWIGRFGISSFVGLMILMAVVMMFMRLGVASIGGATALFIPLSIVIGQNAGLHVNQVVALAWVTYVFCRAGYLLPQQGAPLITSYSYDFFSRGDLFRVGVPLTLATLFIYGLWAIFVIPALV
ncbi:MAG: SLC13 family permease [Negativicutes bacterium]|nr:SLC13 family permease [Negativicutes bacterium]